MKVVESTLVTCKDAGPSGLRFLFSHELFHFRAGQNPRSSPSGGRKSTVDQGIQLGGRRQFLFSVPGNQSQEDNPSGMAARCMHYRPTGPSSIWLECHPL